MNEVFVGGPFLVGQCGPCLPDIAQGHHCLIVAYHFSDGGVAACRVNHLGINPAAVARINGEGVQVVAILLNVGQTDIDGFSCAVAEVELIRKILTVLLLIHGPAIVGIGISLNHDAAYQFVYAHLVQER